MDIENVLTKKILDPIHGIIRLTALEVEFINHPLFQRLRNIKQNSFLYKVFPSAVHSRFEHSLGVMHLSTEILKNLHLNAIRYATKYNDGHVFEQINALPRHHVQALRLAALMHDVGHGPMSHQFDSFMPTRQELADFLDEKYHPVLAVLPETGDRVEHEQISLIFCLIIYNDLVEQGKIGTPIDIETVLKIIDKRYGDGKMMAEIGGRQIDLLPLMTSIISSCPIDADRMDYLLRDGYFSGVKCGIYDYNRLFMSIVPVEEDDKVYLAYKESGIDSIVEFIGARSSLFSQVYYHKTNRSFSSMLNKICENMVADNAKNLIIADIDDSDIPGRSESEDHTVALTGFYLDCSDDFFLNEKVAEWIMQSSQYEPNRRILNDIVHRRPWSKIYESKTLLNNKSINDTADKTFQQNIRLQLSAILDRELKKNQYAIDLVTDTAFKDIDKTEVKLLVKNRNESYTIRPLSQCGDKLDPFQSIKYFIRVFVERDLKNSLSPDLIAQIDSAIQQAVGSL